jgi:hypothetical protein
MTTKLVWFGNFEFGDFDKCGDKFPCVLIHSIVEKVYIEEDEIEDFMEVNKHDSWMIPSIWQGELFYSKQFMKELSL